MDSLNKMISERYSIPKDSEVSLFKRYDRMIREIAGVFEEIYDQLKIIGEKNETE